MMARHTRAPDVTRLARVIDVIVALRPKVTQIFTEVLTTKSQGGMC